MIRDLIRIVRTRETVIRVTPPAKNRHRLLTEGSKSIGFISYGPVTGPIQKKLLTRNITKRRPHLQTPATAFKQVYNEHESDFSK